MRKRPNILLIMLDQLRYDCLGYAGAFPVRTPNIDRLAAGGAWMERAYTSNPVCCPARQAMMTGRRPESYGALWNFHITLDVKSMGPDMPTFSKALADAGYETALMSRWDASQGHGPKEFGYGTHYSERDYIDWRKGRHPDGAGMSGWGVDPVPLEDSPTHRTAAMAVEWMRDRAKDPETPWHMNFNISEPHLPCRANARFMDMYDPASIPRWGSFDDSMEGKPYAQRQAVHSRELSAKADWAKASELVRCYYATISQIDDAVGMLMGFLDEAGLWGDTLVALTADHGDMCGSHRLFDKHMVMYEDVLRVPAIVRWDGVIPPGQRRAEHSVNTLDVPATFMEAAGLGVPEGWHGRSLLPLLTGSSDAGGWPDFAVSAYNGQQYGLYCQRAIVSGDHKYVWNPTDLDELYDLRADPWELDNRIHDAGLTDVLASLRLRLHDELRRCGDGLVKGPWLDSHLLHGKKL